MQYSRCLLRLLATDQWRRRRRLMVRPTVVVADDNASSPPKVSPAVVLLDPPPLEDRPRDQERVRRHVRVVASVCGRPRQGLQLRRHSQRVLLGDHVPARELRVERVHGGSQSLGRRRQEKRILASVWRAEMVPRGARGLRLGRGCRRGSCRIAE